MSKRSEDALEIIERKQALVGEVRSIYYKDLHGLMIKLKRVMTKDDSERFASDMEWINVGLTTQTDILKEVREAFDK